jgi:uncharacterized membrane protein
MMSRDRSQQSSRWYDGGLGNALAQRRKLHIVIVVILILLTGLLNGLNVNGMFLPVRRICGLIFVLFVPGYALQEVLFPREEALDGPERLALSIGLSVAFAPVFAWGLDRLPFTRIARWPILIAEGSFAVLCLAIARIKERQLQSRVDPSRSVASAAMARADLRDRPTCSGGNSAGGLIKRFSTWWVRRDRVDRWLLLFLTGALTMAALSAASLSGDTLLGSSTDETLTEFYILGADGLGEAYLRTGHGTTASTAFSSRQPITVTIGIHNMEASAANYRIFVVYKSDTISQATLITETGTLQLAAGERREFRLSFEAPAAFVPFVDRETSSRPFEVQFLLYREGIDVPYRTLRLWLNVVE